MRRITFLFLLLSAQLYAQDSTRFLTLSDVLSLAAEYHPIVKQTDLQERMARAQVLSAKGYFDPKIQSTYSSKELNDKTYYSKFNSALKVPLWFPIDPKVEIYQNKGDQLNPESYVSSSQDYWQVSAGISLPIGKGLFIDERRMLVKQAKIYAEIADAEQIKQTNKTLLIITKAYWEWFFAYEQLQLMQRSIAIADEIYRRTKLDFEYGEAAAMDTIQAKITLQSREVDYEKAKLAMIEARNLMSVHLWGPDFTPMEIPESTLPSAESFNDWIIPTDSSFQTLLSWSATNHPEIRKYESKINQLEVQEKWNKESFKPEIDLSYSLLDAPLDINGSSTPEWTESYKLGLDFSFPLYLRKERGNLEKTRVYKETIAFDLMQARQEVRAQIASTYAGLLTNQKLEQQYESLSNNYETLLQAEMLNLQTGESDLFKMNVQQDKFIQARLKYLEAKVKLEKMKAQLPYEIGLPDLSYFAMYE